MKKFSNLLAIVMVLSLIVSVMSVASSAIDSGDWEVVSAPGATPEKTVLETTENKGIRLTHEGHYPENNAGLLYSKPLDIKNGISLNVTVETNADGSSDAWHGIFLMNKPVYFDVSNRDPEKGFGIVLLCRPGNAFQWFYITEKGFAQIPTTTAGADGKSYYVDGGVTIDYEIKLEGDELNIYVDGAKVDADFASYLIPYLTDDQAYIGFSMSQTELEKQSFVINYLNGEQAASEGDAITAADDQTDAETEETVGESTDTFMLIDFSLPESLTRVTNTNNCKISYDEAEAAIKVEVTGEDPFFYISMKKANFFDSEKYSIALLEYKTDCEGLGEFFYTTRETPIMSQQTNVQYEITPTNGEFVVLEQDMQESMSWYDKIRSFRIDPITEFEEGENPVFYYKSLSFKEYVEEETEPVQTEENTEVETEEVTEATNDTTPDAKTDAVTGNNNNNNTNQGGIPDFVWIIVGVVTVAAIVAVVVIILKKKK